MSELVVDFAWFVAGPFVTAGAEATPSVDMIFHRDAAGRLCVGKSHVKGKFLEAALGACDAGLARTEWLHWWFGEADLVRSRGERVFFSDLRPVAPGADDASWVRSELSTGAIAGDARPRGVRPWPADFAELASGASSLVTRTELDEHGTAAEHTLRVTETQPRGLELAWAGRVQAEHCDAAELEALAALLCLCHARVENLGASTSVGYGRILTPGAGPLFRVRIDGQDVTRAAVEATCRTAREDRRWADRPAPAAATQSAVTPTAAASSREYGLVLSPLEPVYVLDRKRPDAHFFTGPDHVSGAVLKGALAAALNRVAGLPLTSAIVPDHPAAARFPCLCAQFSEVRFLHALPLPRSWRGEPIQRPHPIPLSAFSAGKQAAQVWDAALSWDDAQPAPGVDRASFAPDCDELSGYVCAPGTAGDGLGAHSVVKGTETRVAIHEASGAAAMGQLFGYEYLADVAVREPAGGAEREVYRPAFATGVVVPDDGDGLAQHLWSELSEILPSARIGKTNAAVEFVPVDQPAIPLTERLRVYGDAPVVLTLVTDTLLPLATEEMQSMTDMTPLYDVAWGQVWELLGAEAGEPGRGRLHVAEVFARQSLRGGWIGRRGRSGSYQAFCLTLAGSVFVTDTPASAAVADPSLLGLLESAEERGLPLMGDGLTWSTCPFVPQNGFGEVLVCPAWHLERRPTRVGGSLT